MAETLNHDEMEALGQALWQKQLTAVEFAPVVKGEVFITPAKTADREKAESTLVKLRTAETIEVNDAEKGKK